ncbi:hypothetical protein KIS4809_5614 [Bacillus sp. ZZV12-4809]|nr:hypothetical protein KIS4809_5614 [Bacillus sp. ZZV12-4809]
MSERVGGRIYYQKSLQESIEESDGLDFSDFGVLQSLPLMLIYNIEIHSLGGDESGHCNCSA